MNDWAKKAADKLQRQEQNMNTHEERLNREDEAKQREGINLFIQACAWAREEIKKFNLDQGKEVLHYLTVPASKFKVVARLMPTQRELEAEYYKGSCRIGYEVTQRGKILKNGAFQIGIAGDGTVVIKNDSDIEFMPESVGNQMLSDLMA